MELYFYTNKLEVNKRKKRDKLREVTKICFQFNRWYLI